MKTVFACALALAGLLACGDGDDATSPAADDGIRIASFDFVESELLAELYAAALEEADIPVVRLGPIGPREVVEPALESDLVDVVPEYVGTASAYVGAESPDIAELRASLAARGLTALEPAAAQDMNVVVVTRERAEADGYRRVSDLADVASMWRFGGPVECPDRPLCLLGLAETYGLTFAEFVPQRSLAVTAEALRQGEIEAGLMFSTAAELEPDEFLALEDDLGMQPPENVVPVARLDALQRWGPAVADVLDGVSARLTTDELREMNRSIEDGETIDTVAASWLARVGVVADRGAD